MPAFRKWYHQRTVADRISLVPGSVLYNLYVYASEGIKVESLGGNLGELESELQYVYRLRFNADVRFQFLSAMQLVTVGIIILEDFCFHKETEPKQRFKDTFKMKVLYNDWSKN